MMAINGAVNNGVNGLGIKSGNNAGNSPVTTMAAGPRSGENKIKRQDPEQENRSDYKQVSSEVEKAEEGQPGSAAINETEIDEEALQAVNQNSVVQSSEPLSVPVSVDGQSVHHQGGAAMQLEGNATPDTQVNQGQSIALLQSIKHQAQTAEGAATVKQQVSDQIKSDATVAATATNTDTTAAVTEAVALAKSTLATVGQNPLASAHDVKKTLDVASLRVEQQVGDVVLVDRLSSQPAPTKYEWAAVKLDNQQQNWSRQLFNVLQDRIEMQINQHITQAKIRLDPPELGRLELSVRFEGDRLTVVVQAGNASVREALQASLEQLRGELANQFGTSVDVNVGGDDSLAKQFKESENNVAFHSFEEQETLEPVTAHQSGWFNALA